jgi:hypothetical protein
MVAHGGGATMVVEPGVVRAVAHGGAQDRVRNWGRFGGIHRQ